MIYFLLLTSKQPSNAAQHFVTSYGSLKIAAMGKLRSDLSTAFNESAALKCDYKICKRYGSAKIANLRVLGRDLLTASNE